MTNIPKRELTRSGNRHVTEESKVPTLSTAQEAEGPVLDGLSQRTKRTYRIAVGSNLKGKIAEMGFFLGHILRVSEIIKIKHVTSNYPLNSETEEINYVFSAYLNSIQAIKDSCQTAMNTDITWKELSPKYGKFVYYCRNATTHDGSLMINAWRGPHGYIVGPLWYIDNKGKVKEVTPPPEDIVALCRNSAQEVLQCVKTLVAKNGANLLVPKHADLIAVLDEFRNSDFAPSFVKHIMIERRDEISCSLHNANFNYAKDTLQAIEKVQKAFGFDAE